MIGRKNIALIIYLCLFSVSALAEEKKIHVVCDIWPPYQTIEQGIVNGFSTKVVKEVFDRMGVEVQSLERYPWKRALYMLKNDTIDALYSANYAQERTAFAYYPDEAIVQSPWVVWSREEDAFTYESFNDLKGKNIGIVRGYSYTKEFLDFVKLHAHRDEVTDDATNFKKLRSGRIDVAVAEVGNGNFILNNLKIKHIIPHLGNPVKVDGLYILFNKNRIQKEFVAQFSKELKKLKRESLYTTWYDVYFKK